MEHFIEAAYRRARFDVESWFKWHEHLLPPRLQGQNFYNMFNEHLRKRMSDDELSKNARSLMELISQVAAEESKRQEQLDLEQESLSKANEPPYHDSISAMEYFKNEAEKVKALDLAPEDIEMLLISINKKRQRVLDELI